MKKTVVLDTNALLRFLLKDISTQHKKIEKLLIDAKHNKTIVILPEVVFFETYFTLKSYYGYGKEVLLDMSESLIASEYLRIENKPVFALAIQIFKNTNLEFVDCYLAAKCKIFNLDLFTFDKKLDKYTKNY